MKVRGRVGKSRFTQFFKAGQKPLGDVFGVGIHVDFEVEEVFNDDEGIVIYAPFEQFGALQKYFEDNNIEILSSGFERIPSTTTKLTEEQQADVEKLLDRLDEDDDVQNVYHSMEM